MEGEAPPCDRRNDRRNESLESNRLSLIRARYEGKASVQFKKFMSDATNEDSYRPMMSEERAAQIRQWHENALTEQVRKDAIEVTVLNRKFEVPADIFEPKSVGLWQSILEETKETDRVLDMGTGSGVNAVLAASKSSDVVAVDVNPASIQTAKHNADLNNVAARIHFAVSDLFESVEGRFDLIMFDPPFRWFKPRNMRERSTADENYQTLTTFFDKAKDYLAPDGRILLFFGSSGDMNYLNHLIQETGFKKTVIRRSEHEKNGIPVEYVTYRLVQMSDDT